ncbi:MAG TPA: succinate dehydrogenase assembly factor 2 [Hyphomicrobiaceae bacterium]|jgi:antitoxin CptB|nr:succinate dehydrogenase assembly factor 2 [Hyphomicrobiaceae bacterium]
MTDDEQSRRRRAIYRAAHRGTKEMDWLLGRYAETAVAGMSLEGLARFERLIGLPDPEIYDMIFNPQLSSGTGYGDLIAELRGFHGLQRD